MTTVNSTPMSLRISSNKHVVHERKYVDPQLKSDLEGSHTQIASAAFLEAMVPQHPEKGWDEFLKAVENDEAISAEIETSSFAEREPQLYEPFAIIANQITDLFKEHCGSSVEREIKFFGLGSSYITGPPSYDNGEPVEGTESKRQPDGLALMAEDFEEGDCFKQHEKKGHGQHVAGRDLSDGWRKSILAVEHKLSSTVDKKLYATSQPRVAANRQPSSSTTKSSSMFTPSSANVTSHKSISDPRTRDNMQTSSKAKLPRNRASSSQPQPKHHHQTRLSVKSSSSAPVEAVTSKGFVLPSHASDGSNKRTRRDSDEDSDEDEDEKPQKSRPDKKRRREAQIRQGVSDPAPIELTGDELQLASYVMEMMCVLGNRAHAFGILIDRFKTTFWYYDRSGAVSSESFDFRYNLELLARFIVAFSYMSTTQLGFIPELQPPKGVPLNSIAALAPKSLADFTMDCGDVTVTLVKPLEVRYGFVGRGTVVYEVKMRKNADPAGGSEASDIEEEVAVVKLSWQVATRRPEWEWIEEALREGVPQELIIEVFGHRVLQTLSAGFRSQLLLGASSGGKWENRELRIQTMEKLSSIADLSGIELMFAIWCYLLTIEFLDYANIRHRDISPGNLGWIRKGRCLYPKIMDFDLAAHVLREEGELAASKHWTGTLPYMAVDLLRYPGCGHPLRFDAESIIWCATWLSCCAKKNYAEKNHPFLAWFDPLSSLTTIANEKSGTMGFTRASIPTLSRNKVMERGLLGVMWLYGMVYHKSTYWALNERAQGRPEPGPVE
ncbi:hypothetical protein FRB98_009439, partial [Tulasnella sp. 332]